MGIGLTALLLAFNADYARADSSSFLSDISQLENSFFDHDYKGEDDTARLDRLEKFVFGEVHSGSEGQRITKLLLATPPGRKKIDKEDSTGTVKSSEKIENQSSSEPEESGESSSAGWQDQRLASLEKQILGTTYSGESAGKRVARLEKTKFGHSSGNGNIDDRLTILEAYAKSPNAPSQPAERTIESPEMPQEEAQESGFQPEGSAQLPTSVNQEMGNLVQRVGAMEITVFGHKSTKLPLLERIQRLEKEVGVNTQELAQKDLPTQVDSLWSQVGSNSQISGSRKFKTRMMPSDSYASGTFSEPGDQIGQNFNDSQNQGTHQSWLHKLGRAIGGVGGLAAGALMSPSFSPYYGYGGYNPYGPYGMYGNSYMNPYLSPWGGGFGGYGGYYPGLGTYGGYYPGLGTYGGYYPGLGTYGWGGSPFGGNSFIHF